MNSTQYIILLIGVKLGNTDCKWLSCVNSLLKYYKNIEQICPSNTTVLHTPVRVKLKWAWLNVYYSENSDGKWLDSLQFEKQLPVLVQRSDAKPKQTSVSDKLHALADKLNGNENYVVELMWLTNCIHKLDQSVGLYGSLLRLQTYHKCKTTIVSSDSPSQDIQQWVTSLPASTCKIVELEHVLREAPKFNLWRGSLEVLTENDFSNFKNFQLVQQLNSFGHFEAPCPFSEGKRTKFGSILQLVEDCDVRTVPSYLFSNVSFVLESVCDTAETTDLFSALRPTYFRTTVFRLYSSDNDGKNFTTEMWKSAVLSDTMPEIAKSDTTRSYVEFVSIVDSSLESNRIRLQCIRDPSSLGIFPALLLQLDISESKSRSEICDESTESLVNEFFQNLPELCEEEVGECGVKDFMENLPHLPGRGSCIELDPADWPEREWLYSREKVETHPFTLSGGKRLEIREILKPFDRTGNLKESFRRSLLPIGGISARRPHVKTTAPKQHDKLKAADYDIYYNTSDEVERRQVASVERQRALIPHETATVCNVWSNGIEIPLLPAKNDAKPPIKAKRELAKTPVKKVVSSGALATRHSPRLKAKYRQEVKKPCATVEPRKSNPAVPPALKTPVKQKTATCEAKCSQSTPSKTKSPVSVKQNSPDGKTKAMPINLEFKTPVKKIQASHLSSVRHSPRLQARAEPFTKHSPTSVAKALNRAVVQILELHGVTDGSNSYEYCVQKLTGVCQQFVDDIDGQDLLQECMEIAKLHAGGVVKLANKRKT